MRLAPIRGARVVIGFAGLVDGPLDAPGARERALDLLRATGFADTGGRPVGRRPGPGRRSACARHLAAHPEVQA